MKKALFIFVAVAIALALACRENSPGNANGNYNAAANNNKETPLAPLADQPVKITAKFVPGPPPELIIADVDPSPVSIRNGQKISWSVVYEAPYDSKQQVTITIDDFKSGGNNTDLFGDGSKYQFQALLGNAPVPLSTTGPANSPIGPAEYKYKISFTLEGLFKTTLDPRIVISN